jgi:hypothetical protein
VTWQATFLGGPEDGLTITLPGDEPPPTLVIQVPRPLTRHDFADADGPAVTSAETDEIVCLRTRTSDGRWLFVWPTR